MVKVPAFGWATYTLDARCAEMFGIPSVDGRTDDYTCDDIILENGLIKPFSAAAQWSCCPHRQVFRHGACFRALVLLPPYYRKHGARHDLMDCGRIYDCQKLKRGVQRPRVRKNIGGVRQSVSYEFPFGTRSKLGVTVSLDEGSSMLVFDTMIDFHEIGDRSGVQQVNFLFPSATLRKLSLRRAVRYC